MLGKNLIKLLYLIELIDLAPIQLIEISRFECKLHTELQKFLI